jgi:hypothetical protein
MLQRKEETSSFMVLWLVSVRMLAMGPLVAI